MSEINPRVDLAFKKIFGVEGNEDLLISLVNSIVSKEDQIVEATLLNPYNAKNFQKDKLSILDIKAKSENGKMFNVEIQVNDEADYDKRALYYWSKMYTQQLREGSDYSELKKTIGIHILNFTSITDTEQYHHAFDLTDKYTGIKYFEDIELHTIELNKFARNPKEGLSDIVKKVKNALDIWLAFLTRHDLLNKDNLPKELDNKDLKKALNVLEVLNFTPEEREAYDDRLKWLRTEASAIKKAEARGEIKGRAEGKVELIQMMLKQGKTIQQIVEFTGLSIEEVEKSKK